MTSPTTVFDLSTPERIAALRAEADGIDRDLRSEPDMDPDERATLTRRRDRLIAALDTLKGEG